MLPCVEPITRRPLFSTGFRRACSPASSIRRDAPTPCRPSRRTSFPSLGDTIVASQSSSPAARDTGPWIILELLSRVSNRHFDGDGKVSQVPGEPS